MSLADDLARAKRLEQIKHLDAGEAVIKETVAAITPTIELNAADHELLRPYVNWTTSASVRAVPAKPFVVAAFALHLKALGATAERIMETLAAIQKLHDHNNLSSPVHTVITRSALDQIIVVEPPRSWPASEKVAFAELPADIKLAVGRRELERDTSVRRTHNLLAEERKALKRETETKPTTEKEKTTNG